MKINFQKLIIISLAISTISMCCVFPVSADDSSVINKINISTNTGGNISDNGEAIQRGSEINGEIKVIINGEKIVDEQIQNKSATDTNIKIKNKVEVQDEKATVEINKTIGEAEINESHEVGLDNIKQESAKPALMKIEEKIDAVKKTREEKNLETFELTSTSAEKIEQEHMNPVHKKKSFVLVFWKNIINNIKNLIINIFA